MITGSLFRPAARHRAQAFGNFVRVRLINIHTRNDRRQQSHPAQIIAETIQRIPPPHKSVAACNA
jgi:hypothetical protein